MDFFKDLVKLKKKGKLVNFVSFVKNGLIYFNLGSALCDYYVEYYETEYKPVIIKNRQIRDWIKNQPGFLGMMISKKINGKVMRCVVFLASKAPRELLELIDGKPVDNRRPIAAKL